MSKPDLIHYYLQRAPRWSRAWHRMLAKVAPARQELTFYAAAEDPHSYLTAQMLEYLQQSPLVPDFVVRVVPVAESVDATNPEPELRRAFVRRDSAALAAYYTHLRFGADNDAPSNEHVQLARQALVASPSLETMLAIGDALWGQNDKGLELGPLRNSSTASSDDALKTTLLNGTRALNRAGHYQPGAIRYFGEWFVGPMRGQSLARRIAEQAGATEDEAERVAWSVAFPVDADNGEAASSEGTQEPVLNLWVSFRSPYSYLAVTRIRAWQRAGESWRVKVHPVLPMVSRGLAVPRAKKRYLVFDAAREAALLGLPFGRIADPLGAGVDRCLAVCAEIAAGEEPGRLFPFVASALKGIWSEGLDVASDEGLVEVAERAGVARDEVWMATTNLPSGQALAGRSREGLLATGLWGVPSFQVGNIVTWGQDRLPLVRAAMGLPPVNERPIR